MLHPARKMQHSQEAVIRAHRQGSGGSPRGACSQAWPWSGSTLACGTLMLRPYRSHSDAAQHCTTARLQASAAGRKCCMGNRTTIILSTACVHRLPAADAWVFSTDGSSNASNGPTSSVMNHLKPDLCLAAAGNKRKQHFFSGTAMLITAAAAALQHAPLKNERCSSMYTMRGVQQGSTLYIVTTAIATTASLSCRADIILGLRISCES